METSAHVDTLAILDHIKIAAAKQHLASRAQVRSPFPPARLKYQASYRRCAKMILKMYPGAAPTKSPSSDAGTLW